jgi:hypothetical protein
MHPRFVIADTSTLETITGANFVDGLVCSFAGTTVPAHFVSSSEIHCVAPPLMRGLVASVFLIREQWIGQVIDPVGQLEFTYVGAAIEVFDSSPATLSQRGGEQVTVKLSNLGARNVASFMAPKCTFGVVQVAAQMAHAQNRITCTSPGGPVGNVSLEITFDGLGNDTSPVTWTYHEGDHSRSPWTFQRTRPVNVTSYSPVGCPSNGCRGVMVTGMNYFSKDILWNGQESATDLYCHFAAQTFGSPNTVPTSFGFTAGKIIGQQTWITHQERNIPTVSNVLTCSLPTHYEGYHTLEVSNEQSGLSSTSGHVFEFHRPFEVHDLYPLAGTVYGGSTITITGNGFAAPVYCKFGSANAGVATVKSLTEVECTTPQHGAGQVDLRILRHDLTAEGWVQLVCNQLLPSQPCSGPKTHSQRVGFRFRSLLSPG